MLSMPKYRQINIMRSTIVRHSLCDVLTSGT